MRGTVEFGKDRFSKNTAFGPISMKSGYNFHIRSVKSPEMDIVRLVFPSLESKKNFRNQWVNEFFKK